MARLARPWSVAAAGLTAAHHAVELSAGVGLVFQAELGLVGASALWGLQLPTWAALAARGGRRCDGVLAATAGTALAGSLVHWAIWPRRRGPLGLPVVTEAEGLPEGILPAYSALLHVWAAAAALAVVVDAPRESRRWALAGLAAAPVLALSARHHFTWIRREALERPAWWNRAAATA